VEVGKAGFIDHYGLAFEDEAFGVDHRRLLGEITISGCPVEAVLGVEPDAVFVLDDLRAIAIEFDLVAPRVAYRRCVEQLRLHRLDKF
jgi:hypothetical protein